jgi:histone H3/H4
MADEEIETLVVVSKIKADVKARGLRSDSSSLNKHVKLMIDAASKRAEAAGRKTVSGDDI